MSPPSPAHAFRATKTRLAIGKTTGSWRNVRQPRTGVARRSRNLARGGRGSHSEFARLWSSCNRCAPGGEWLRPFGRKNCRCSPRRSRIVFGARRIYVHRVRFRAGVSPELNAVELVEPPPNPIPLPLRLQARLAMIDDPELASVIGGCRKLLAGPRGPPCRRW